MVDKKASKKDVDVKKVKVVETPKADYEVISDAQGRAWKIDKDGKRIGRA